ncbi:MAG: TlpA family protein disulfide reductase [Bacillati bacterium ANGP1]|uniref:TlpA family protein disulfide reductase n=1 Tax=Candidatus Segetimicrobium genomatis TaxID=2569760 RepID=A0A537JWJ3_9BACT|nr:MAG: TlpA family protein disulfide reductase [Terrabacteria group bacterium ANGP1]
MSAREHPSRPWAALLIPVAVLLGFLALVTAQHQRSLAVGTALARGETPPAPPVTFPTFEGGRVSLGDLRGHPIVMNFWAAWCVPCREEAPLLEGIWKAYREKGLVVLGVDTQDLSEPARGFITRFGITYPNVRDPDGSVAHLFGATGVPETFFIGADGRVLGKFPGEEVAASAWRAAAEALLAGRAHVPWPTWPAP